MTARIRSWQTRNISFAGRLQLVNAVLMSICTFWMQIFILPKSVIQEINKICRRFLWEGKIHGSKPGYVSWDKVCKTKSKGGLGLKNLQLWNTIAVGKLIWQIDENKDSLWVKWVHSVYIKHQDWWNYRPSRLASWIWRSICSVKKDLEDWNRESW
ncbi:hypothetical protein RDABS01_038569 [Bienertia sinuspersici]